MPRDANGNYTLPAGNPVIAGTFILDTWANPTMSDIGNEITDSLSRSGEGGMLAPLKLLNGTALLPALTFLNEIQSGMYLAGAGQIVLSIGGTDVMRWQSGTVEIWDGATWQPVATFGGSIGTDDVTNQSGVAGATASDALDTLDSDIGALAGVVGALTSGDIGNASIVAGTTVTDALDNLDINVNNLGAVVAGLDSDDIDNSSGVAGASVSNALDTLEIAINNLTIYDSDLTLDDEFTAGSVRLTASRVTGGYWVNLYGRGSHGSASAASSTALIPAPYRPANTVSNTVSADALILQSRIFSSGVIQMLHYDDALAPINVTAVDAQLSASWFVAD